MEKLKHYADWGINLVYIKNERKVSILRYWTTRYLITLCVGLLVIAVVSAIWIRHTTLEHRLNMTQLLADEIANRFVDMTTGDPSASKDVTDFLSGRGRFMDIESDPSIYIVNTEGSVLSSNRGKYGYRIQVPQSVLLNGKNVQKIESNQEYFYIVKSPIQIQNVRLGWVVITELEDNLTRVNQEYRQLAIMIIGVALLGWLAIYFLSKRLANPIKDVAKAAKLVQEGNYNIRLENDIKEQEVYDLVQSFKNMSQRLQELESLRKELLAGVTHELKTPVTSISGLLQALHDGVVQGENAKEFIELGLKETDKMKKMIEDLLDFNTFSSYHVTIQPQTYFVNEIISEIVSQWKTLNNDNSITINTFLLKKDKKVHVDFIRLQQIFTNLLNNSVHAIEGEGKINVVLTESEDKILIDVEDNGTGISEKEQSLIFERFYRGENKKYKTRGLGLGLPFSKMIAQSMGGDLFLKRSTSSGSTFTVTLPKGK